MMVMVNGTAYEWSAADGLDPAAALELRGWIVKESERFRWAIGPVIDRDDLIQAGYTGAVAAARSYNPESKATYMTWAAYKILDAIKALVRTRKRDEVSIDACNDDEEALAERLASDIDVHEEAAIRLELEALLKKISKKDREIFIQRVYSLKDAYKLQRVSKNTVLNRAERIAKKMLKIKLSSAI